MTVTTRHIDSEATVVVYSGEAKRDVILGAEKAYWTLTKFGFSGSGLFTKD